MRPPGYMPFLLTWWPFIVSLRNCYAGDPLASTRLHRRGDIAVPFRPLWVCCSARVHPVVEASTSTSFSVSTMAVRISRRLPRGLPLMVPAPRPEGILICGWGCLGGCRGPCLPDQALCLHATIFSVPTAAH